MYVCVFCYCQRQETRLRLTRVFFLVFGGMSAWSQYICEEFRLSVAPCGSLTLSHRCCFFFTFSLLILAAKKPSMTQFLTRRAMPKRARWKRINASIMLNTLSWLCNRLYADRPASGALLSGKNVASVRKQRPAYGLGRPRRLCCLCHTLLLAVCVCVCVLSAIKCHVFTTTLTGAVVSM